MDISLNSTQITMLLKLFFSNYTKQHYANSLSNIETNCGVSQGNPTARKLFSYLFSQHILICETNEILAVSKYYVDKKLLSKLIENLELTKLMNKFFVYQIP